MRHSLKKISSDYFIIPNDLIRDITLSPHARTLYCYMASMDDSWNFNNSNLMKAIGVKEDKLRKVIKELINKGWLNRVDKIIKGLKQGYDYELYADNTRHRAKTTTVENDPLEDNNTSREEKPAKMQDVFEYEDDFKHLWKDYTLTFLKAKDRRGGSKEKALNKYKILIKDGYNPHAIYDYCEDHCGLAIGHKDLERLLDIKAVKQYFEDSNV